MILLVAHGSPDPDWRRPIEAMAARARQRAPERVIRVAYMEFTDPRVLEVAQQLAREGHRVVRVIPAFLSPGGRHIKRDLPALVESVAAQVPELELSLAPGALGTHPQVLDALATAALEAAHLDENADEDSA